MKINFVEKIIGSGFFSGYIPFAPGTMGSLVGLGIFMIPGFENPTLMLSLILVFTLMGVYVANKFEQVYGKDPSICVVDEIIGTWISLLFLPKEIFVIAVAFIIWRLLDIFKPPPIGLMEKISGGWGIMLDDIVAGLITLVIVQLGLFLL
ncbi:MAG: phosphatidylglycerophosphatase A [Melioribacteraceae bacterium]|nr:phosphatidylglycerophosphatase A [Melioribacteraceae bacterium]